MKLSQSIALFITAVLLTTAFLVVPWAYPMGRIGMSDAGYATVFSPPPCSARTSAPPTIDLKRWIAQLLAVPPAGIVIFILARPIFDEVATGEESAEDGDKDGEEDQDESVSADD